MDALLWEQDRIGMLLPLVAMPFRAPLANLLVQDGLAICSGLTAIVLLARWAVAGVAWPAVGLVAAAMLLACAPDEVRFEYLVDQPYGPSLALGGLLVAGRGGPARAALGLGLVGLAHWVNAAAGLPLLAYVVVRALLEARGRAGAVPLGRTLALLLAGMAAGFGVPRVLPLADTTRGLLPPGEWPLAWAALARAVWTALEPPRLPLALAALATAGVALLAAVPARRRSPPYVRAAAALVAAAAAYGAWAGTAVWVQRNAFDYRYVLPSLVCVLTGVVALAVGPAVAALGVRARRGAHAASAACLVLAALGIYGPPSLARVRADVAAAAGGLTADVIAARCTHLIGRYWTVWPTVFHVDAVRYEAGERTPLWGITMRSAVTRSRWDARPRRRWRLCAAVDDADVDVHRRNYGIPRLAERDRVGDVVVYGVGR